VLKTEIQDPSLSVDSVSLHQNDVIDLKEVMAAIWAGKWLIVCVAALFAVASIIYALSIPDEYKSTAILVPASSSNSSGGSLSGQLGGLAALAGLSKGAGDSNTVVAMSLIETWGFLESFIVNNHLEPEVFAVRGWDRANNKLIYDSKIFDATNNVWLDEGGVPSQAAKPSSWKLYLSIKNKINISQDEATGLISLSVEHYSPFVAKKWLDKLIVAINMHAKSRDRADALESIKYLKSQINKTNVSEMQAVFYQIIEEQTKTLMLAEISSEYVLKTISSGKVAEIKSKPKRALMVIFFTLLGSMLAMTFVLVSHFKKGGGN
tara:strand:- start:16365 stop:17327 length:963 start_codon:yes stop_codon:yes gene_type:complete